MALLGILDAGGCDVEMLHALDFFGFDDTVTSVILFPIGRPRSAVSDEMGTAR
jgi:hypothetical protein